MPVPEEVERNAEIYKKYIIGCSQRSLAEEYGLAQQRIAQIIAAQREKNDPQERADQAQRSFEFLNDLRQQAYEIAQLVPAPVAVGKDGNVLYDPVSGQVVRDYSGRLNAAETAAKMDDRLRRLLGTDAPARSQVESTVRYEVAGIDPADLQ